MTRLLNGKVSVAIGATGTIALGAGALTMAARRRGMSTSLLLARTLLGFVPKVLASEDRLRAKVKNRVYPKDAPLPASLRHRCEVQETVMDGQTVVTLKPRSGRSDQHMLYLHGGAYFSPMLAAHWSIIGALIQATGASVTLPLYALAPENDYQRGTALVDAVYGQLEEQHPGERIVVAGDSSGGNFALNLVLRRRDGGQTLPDRLILLAPWLDLAMRDERATVMETEDVMLGVAGLRLCGRWWAGDLDPGSPQFSPQVADLSGLPPIALYQGDRDIFVIDARTFVDRCRAAKVDCRYYEYPGAFHVFMGVTFTPEASDVFHIIASFMAADSEQPAENLNKLPFTQHTSNN